MQVLGAAEKRMNRYPLLAPFVGCSAALALAGCAANFSTSPTFGSTSAHAGPMHVLRYFPTRYAPHAIVRGLCSGVRVLSYDNGPALLKPKAYLIFWGYKKYGDADKVAPLLEAYFKAVGGSSHNAVYSQYYDVAGSKTNYITNFKRQLGGVWYDDEHLVPAEPTDAQVAQESLQGVVALRLRRERLIHRRDPPDPGTGWYSFAYGEITECTGRGIQNDRFGKRSYTTGTLYSNASRSCVQEYSGQK
jgi:hypothetical protein